MFKTMYDTGQADNSWWYKDLYQDNSYAKLWGKQHDSGIAFNCEKNKKSQTHTRYE